MTWKVLEEIDAKIEKLRTRTEKVTRPSSANSRELMSVLYQEVSFFQDDLSEQRQTFYNGDRDTLVVQRMAVSVSMEYAVDPSLPFFLPNPPKAGERVSLQKSPIGWRYVGWQLFIEEPAGFDFQWNYVVNSRQSQYSRDPCCSDMLVGLDKGQMLDFRIPLVIPKSESIEFRVQPLRYPLPDSPGREPGTKYYVGFYGLGYRSMP